MFDVSDAHGFRKTVAGICMILCPAAFLASSLVAPGFESDAAAFAAVVAQSPDAFAAAQLLALVGWALFLPAVLGIMHMLRERGVAEGHVGGTLAIVGAVAAIAQAGFALAVWQAGSVEQMTALLAAMDDGSLTMLVLSALPLAVALGTIVLAWGLYRREFVAAWMAASIALSAVALALASVIAAQWLFVAAALLLLAGLGSLGRMVLGESVEDWQHTPRFRGMGTAH